MNKLTSDSRCAWCTDVTQPGFRLRCGMCQQLYCCYRTTYSQNRSRKRCGEAVGAARVMFVCKDCSSGDE